MECHRHIDGDSETFVFRQNRTAAGEVVHPNTAAFVIVGIVIDVFRWGIDRVGNSRPLQPVARTLNKAGITALDRLIVDTVVRFFHFTENVAYTTANLHGVGGDDCAGFGRNAHEFDGGTFTPTLVEREMAEINPCSAAHSLIDTERGCALKAIHAIECVGGAIGERGIGNIDSVAATFGHIGSP